MQRVRCITRELGTSEDDLLIKKIFDSYKKIIMKRPGGYSPEEWELNDTMVLGDYIVRLFMSKVNPILAVDVSSRYSYLTTSFFDLTEICKIKFDRRADMAAVISLGYLVDSVLDNYEQNLKK